VARIRRRRKFPSKRGIVIDMRFSDRSFADWQLYYMLDKCAELHEIGAEWQHVQNRLDGIITEYELFRPCDDTPEYEDREDDWNSDRRSKGSCESADDNYDDNYHRSAT